MFVKPKRFARVIDPDTRIAVSEEGREVPETTYWLRRVRCGDLAIISKPVDTQTAIDDTRPQHQTPENR